MSRRPTQAVILAGGRGTRLRPITDTIPKPMVEFHGKPFLGYVVEMLREQGFSSVLMLLGYLPDVIVDHFGDGADYGLHIDYDVTDPDDLTAYRVQHAADRIDGAFLLVYCDNYWPMRFDDMWRRYKASGAPAQITVYANEDGYSRDSVIVGDDGFVRVFDRTRTTPGLKGIEISYAILDKATVLPLLGDGQELVEQAVYPKLANRRELHAYWSEHRYYSVGGHERLPLTEAFLARRPAVILDRDGVLNERPPKADYVRRPEDVRWLPGAREALRLFGDAGWRVIVVSNQAGVGRGIMSTGEVDDVNEHMRREAVEAGGRIDAVYYCPHGWDEGCACRKPRPGLLFRAQRDFHLDLTRTTFVGDDERDREAALAAGCHPALLSDDVTLLDFTRVLIASGVEEAFR
jgi:D-glycero-D-manno-heptose 1,7-bisphosphate phosphatase